MRERVSERQKSTVSTPSTATTYQTGSNISAVRFDAGLSVGGWKHSDRTDWGNGCGNERLEMGSRGSVRSGGFSILPDWWILGSWRGSVAQRCQPAGAMSAPPSSPRLRASIGKLAVKEEKMVLVHCDGPRKTYRVCCVNTWVGQCTTFNVWVLGWRSLLIKPS